MRPWLRERRREGEKKEGNENENENGKVSGVGTAVMVGNEIGGLGHEAGTENGMA